MALDFGIIGNIFKDSFEDGSVELSAGQRFIPSNQGTTIQEVTYTQHDLPGPGYIDLTGASITLDVVDGQKVFLMATNESDCEATETGATIRFTRGGSQIGQTRSVDIVDTDSEVNMALQHVDEPGNGTFTYKVQGRAFGVAGRDKNNITAGVFTAFVFNS